MSNRLNNRLHDLEQQARLLAAQRSARDLKSDPSVIAARFEIALKELRERMNAGEGDAVLYRTNNGELITVERQYGILVGLVVALKKAQQRAGG